MVFDIFVSRSWSSIGSLEVVIYISDMPNFCLERIRAPAGGRGVVLCSGSGVWIVSLKITFSAQLVLLISF